MGETNTDADFPVKQLSTLDELIHRPRWCIPVLPKGELEVLLNAAIKICKTGSDTTSDHCQKFFREGLKTSFQKLMADECNSNWKPIIRESVFSCTKLFVKLCVTKLSQNCIQTDGCLVLLDTLALSPECQFHSVNRHQPPTISKSDDAIFAKPVIQSDPRGWLVDLVNVFGELNGFDRVLEIFTKRELPSVRVIAALIKPFGLCSNMLTNQTVSKYFIPIIHVFMGLIDGLTDEKLKELWKSDELSTILIAMEEILYVCPENYIQTIAELERIQNKMREKMSLPIGEACKLKSEIVGEELEHMPNDKIVIELTNNQIRTVGDTFTCIICIGILEKPMFATCCRSLIACKPCLERWYRTGTKCPRCRAHKAKDMAFEVAGIDDAINALPFLKDHS